MSTVSPLRQCGRLLAVTLAALLLLSPLAMAMAGVVGLQGLALSAGVCFLPGLVTVWLASVVTDPQAKTWITLSGMLVRMFVVLMAVLICRQLQPQWGLREFYIWLVVFYNVLLLAETWLLLPRGKRP